MSSGARTTPQIVPDNGMGLYFHVPFCATKCPYCDFNTYQAIEYLIGPYLEAVTTGLGLWGRILQQPPVSTVFIGGGTPSYLPEQHVGRLLSALRAAFRVQEDAEVTLEANPDDLVPSKCQELISQGFNRLSIGVQSLDDGLLRLLGRRHGSEQAVEAFNRARAAGFININIDLMYGLPHQSMAQWQDTLRKVVSLGPTHLSLYGLTLEEGTPLKSWVQSGELPAPDDDLAADMYEWAGELLATAGFHHYEISNWAMPGLEGRHNIGYWRNLPYLGLGPGAHSRLGKFRFWEISSPREYLSRVNQWQASNPQPISGLTEEALKQVSTVGGQERIGPELACSETMFLGLRLLEGIHLAEASTQAGADLESVFRTEITELVELGLLERRAGRLRLTSSTYLIANQVFTRFVDTGAVWQAV